MRRITILLFLLCLMDIVLGGMYAAGWRSPIKVEIIVEIISVEILFGISLILTIFVMLFQVMTWELKD